MPARGAPAASPAPASDRFGLFVGLSLLVAAIGLIAPIAGPVILRAAAGVPVRPSWHSLLYGLPMVVWLAMIAYGAVAYGLRALWLVLEAPAVCFWLLLVAPCMTGWDICF